jgi:hypothetical protein
LGNWNSSNWQLAIGKTKCKGFNHKGHKGNTKEQQKQKTQEAKKLQLSPG